MDCLETITVSSKGQVVIPEAMRESMRIKKGSKLVLVQENNRIIIESEKTFLENLKKNKENAEWLSLSQKTMEKVWDNRKDDDTWNRY